MPPDAIKREFEALYEREADALYRFCLLRTSRPEEAEDLVEESFLRVWQSLLAGKVLSEGRGYLYTVARHLIIDWYRKKKTISLDALQEGGDDDVPFDVPEEGAAERVGLSAEMAEVVRAINTLGPEYREAVYLRLVEEMLPKEIAEVLGLNANTVSIRITRGLERLREMLHIEEAI